MRLILCRLMRRPRRRPTFPAADEEASFLRDPLLKQAKSRQQSANKRRYFAEPTDCGGGKAKCQEEGRGGKFICF